MARQHSNGLLSGQLGRVVHYVMNGKGYARSAAFRVKQTEATKRCSELFGQSKRTGSLLRGEITAVLPDLDNRQVMRRFDPALYHWLRLGDMKGYRERLPYLDRFEFNPQSPLHSRFREPFGVDFKDPGKIHCHIPQFELPSESGAPSQTDELQWHIMATSCAVGQQILYGSAYKKIDMPFNGGTVASQNVTFDLEIQKEALTVVVVALRYTAIWKGKYTVVQDPAWQPTAVVGCCYNG